MNDTCVTPTLTAGYFDGIPAKQYHATKALSKSGVGLLVDDCPDAYWWDSPFNETREEEEQSAQFDLGTAAHLILLEPEAFDERTVIVEHDSYRTKAAQEARDDAYAAGLTPLLPHNLLAVQTMRQALMAHPLAQHAFRDGVAERSHFWQDKETGVWCKCRPDFQSADGSFIVDYKTTTNANPRDFARSMRDHYYFVQHPWYLEGIEATTAATPAFWFIAQEKKPPYRLSVMQLDEADVRKGRAYARKARHIFADCLNRGSWPGYTDAKAANIILPNGFQFEFADREERGEFDVAEPTREFANRKHRIHFEAQSPEGISA